MTGRAPAAAARRRYCRCLWLLMLPVVSLIAPLWAAAQTAPAFKPGERLVYRLRWTIFDAGEAELTVRPMKTIDGREAYHFSLAARSNAFIDVFYKVRDNINAYADAGLNHSLHYQKAQLEGSTERDVTVEFDWSGKTARYTKVEKEGTEVKQTPLLPGSFDPLSAMYYVRSIPITGPGMRIERPITDGNKNVVGQVRVIRRETVSAGGQSWDTFLIEPDLKHVGGVFEKSPGAKIQIWVTADHRQIPVLLKSKVVVGSFIGELVGHSGD